MPPSFPSFPSSLLLPPALSMFGDPRELVLHYFLADDTIEILEKIPVNSGRDAVPMFLRRARLPKDPVPLRQPGVETKRTVLNVFGPMGHGGRYILDSLKVSDSHETYCTVKDTYIQGCTKLLTPPLSLVTHPHSHSPHTHTLTLTLRLVP